MLIPIFLHRTDRSTRLSDAERLHFVSQAIESSVDAIAFTDVDGRISFVNYAFVRLWGYQRAADIGGRLLSSFVEPDQSAGVDQRVQNWTGEALGIASNGHRFPIAGSITRIDDPAGGLAGFVASFRDVSDRARAEQALRESEERYRSLVESALDTIFTADATGRFLYVNNAAAAALDRTPAQVAGRTVDELFPPHVAERYRAGVRQVVETGETLRTEDLSEVGGLVRWFSTIVQPMRDPSGRIVAAQAIVRDITARKLAEDRLTRNEERLNQAIRVADIGFFDHDHAKGERYWSPELRRIVGLGPRRSAAAASRAPRTATRRAVDSSRRSAGDRRRGHARARVAIGRLLRRRVPLHAHRRRAALAEGAVADLLSTATARRATRCAPWAARRTSPTARWPKPIAPACRTSSPRRRRWSRWDGWPAVSRTTSTTCSA